MHPPRSKRSKKDGLEFMLLDGAGGNARRFRITSRHVMIALGLWAFAMLLFVVLGFEIG